MKAAKYTIEDLRHDFPDEKACLIWLKENQYPKGITCKICTKVTPHHLMKTRKSFSCEGCGHHVHPMVGTIFEGSSTSLTLWFHAIYVMGATRAGISAKQLEREIGVTYKTAFRMFHQIRSMMKDDEEDLKGKVEIDEAYIHPIPERRSTAKSHNSQVLLGMVERNGRAKVRHIKSSGVRSIMPEVFKGVYPLATVYTDEHQVYTFLKKWDYSHYRTNHFRREYVRGDTHTQNVENLWSNMKRGIRGVYRHVSPKYLQAYANEYAFRYSHRNDYQPMFWAIMNQISK